MKYFERAAFLSKCLCIFRNKLTIDSKQLTKFRPHLSIVVCQLSIYY